MAGIQETYVTMTSSQRDTLLNNVRVAQSTAAQAEARRNAEEQARKRAESRVAAIEQAMLDANKRSDAAVNAMNAELRSLHEEIRHADKQQHDRLAKQAQEHRESLEKQARKTRQAIEQNNLVLRHELDIQRNALEKELAAQRTKFNNELQKNREAINNAVNRINRIEKIANNHQVLARYWVEQANGLTGDIIRFRHKLFFPGELGKIKGDIASASQDMRIQAYQSAIATGRKAFQDASDLKLRVINAENEWNRVYDLWQQELALVVSDFMECDTLMYEIDTTEGREKIPASLNYWSNEKLQIAQSHLETLQTKMANIENIPTETIHNGLRTLKHLSDELSTVRKAGMENLMFSHNRYVQGCHFADVLAGNFAMTDCEGDYEGQEKRESYIGIYKNPATEDTIVVKIKPVLDEFGIMSRDNLEIHYMSKNNNVEQRNQWSKIIASELQKQGIHCGAFVDKEGYTDRSFDQSQMANIEWVRQKKGPYQADGF